MSKMAGLNSAEALKSQIESFGIRYTRLKIGVGLDVKGHAKIESDDGSRYFVCVANITHKEASTILKIQREHGDKLNRAISNGAVAQLRHRIRNGHWQLNGETIIFDEDGVLMDGQHRLTACAMEKSSFLSFLIIGLPRSAFVTLDNGKARRAGDVLGMEGHKNYHTLAAALKYVYMYDEYNGEIVSFMSSERTPDRQDLINTLDKHKSISESVKWVRPNAKYAQLLGLKPSILAFFHWVLSRESASEAERFFDRVLSGEGLVRGSPELALRNLLISTVSGHASGSIRVTRKLKDRDAAFYVFKAWNASRRQKQMNILRIGAKEDFPIPI